MSKFLRDTATVLSREFAPVFLFLFGPLLDGAQAGGPSPWQWFVPGVLIMMCLFGPMMAGYNLLVELGSGSLERMLVTPVDRRAMLVGRTLKEFAILLVQAVLIIALEIPLGFRLEPLGVLAGLALLALFGVGLGSLSFVLAIASHPSGELFFGITQVLLFPLMLLSGVLLPMDLGPGWLRVAAGLNPVSHIVEAERALFDGRFAEPSIGYGVLVAGVIAVAGLVLGTRAMRRGI